MNWFRKKVAPPPFVEGGNNLFFMDRTRIGSLYIRFYEEGGLLWSESIKKFPRISIDDDAIDSIALKTINFGCNVTIETMKIGDNDGRYWFASYNNHKIKLNNVNLFYCPIKLFYPDWMSHFRAIIEDPFTNSRIFRDLTEEKNPEKLEMCEKVLAPYLKR